MIEIRQELPCDSCFYSKPLLGPEKMETGKYCERGTTKTKYRGIPEQRQLKANASSDSVWFWIEQRDARPKYGRPLQEPVQQSRTVL